MPSNTGKVSIRTARLVGLGVALVSIAGIAMAFTLPVPSALHAPAPAKTAPVPALAKPKAPPIAAAPAAPPAYVVTHALTLDGPMKHGDYVWNDDGAPTGEILITIDLKAQMLSVFRGGHEIGVAVILFGGGEKPTPLGAFAITEKDADHVSSIYDDAPMPYMLRLTSDGISIHGSEVAWDWATNGCIGVPVKFAKLLFDQVKLGDVVIITSGRVMRVGDKITAA